MLGSKRIPKCVPSTSWRNVRPQWKILLSLFLLVSKILLWIVAGSIDKEWSSLLEVSFLGSCTAVVLSASFKYWSSTTVARRVLGFPRFVRSSVFLASLSSTLYYSEAPIHSIILRIVAFLERAWPVSSMRIHIVANQVVELLTIYTESCRSAVAAVVGVPLRLGCIVVRILE